jgi:hypothetical protein
MAPAPAPARAPAAAVPLPLVPVEAELTGIGPQGFTLSWPQGPAAGPSGSQFTTFVAPGLMWNDLTPHATPLVDAQGQLTDIGGDCRPRRMSRASSG